MIAPRYVSDPELASYPIVVVAQWETTPWRSHKRTSECDQVGQYIDRWESYTRLKIRSVLRGDAEPGEVELLVSPGIAWTANGSHVTSGTSTEMVGDVRDITKPCLWFLQRERSWDEKIEEEYLSVSNYREVQPLELQGYYLALSQPDAEFAVPTLLSAGQNLVSERVLRYLCGGMWPWPFLEYDFDGRQAYHEPLRAEAPRVWDYLNADVKDLRPIAASVYAELAGEDEIENIRTLLDDLDPTVRAIAVGALAHARDRVASSRLAKAVEGYEDCGTACAVVDALASWNTSRVVPALIEFLQNDLWTHLGVDHIEMPAIKARQALKKITGNVFPFDVALSRKAWHIAVQSDDPTERLRILGEVASSDAAPLVAWAVGAPRKEISEDLKKLVRTPKGYEWSVPVRVQNVSPRAVTIEQYPSGGEVRTSRSYSGFGNHYARMCSRAGFGSATYDQPLFTTIAPGASIEFEVVLNEYFVADSPHKRRLRLLYLDSGKDQGLKAWMGSIDVQFDAEWTSNREGKETAAQDDAPDTNWPASD